MQRLGGLGHCTRAGDAGQGRRLDGIRSVQSAYTVVKLRNHGPSSSCVLLLAHRCSPPIFPRLPEPVAFLAYPSASWPSSFPRLCRLLLSPHPGSSSCQSQAILLSPLRRIPAESGFGAFLVLNVLTFKDPAVQPRSPREVAMPLPASAYDMASTFQPAPWFGPCPLQALGGVAPGRAGLKVSCVWHQYTVVGHSSNASRLDSLPCAGLTPGSQTNRL